MQRLLTSLLLLGCGHLASAATPYQPPRLADGKPDLQGTWAHSNGTPLERPLNVKTQIITAAEAHALEQQRHARLADPKQLGEPVEYFDYLRFEPINGVLRSSQIVDPLDGRIPGTQAMREALFRASVAVLFSFDGPEQRPSSERCLGAVSAQPPMLATLAGSLHQIVQTPANVLITSEINHEARIVRMQAQHLPATLHAWLGDSIGRWEGDTLVIETRHFAPGDQARLGLDIGFMVSPQTTVIERLQRVGPDEISYTFAVEDPTYYTQRWTAESRLVRTRDPMLEFACHEGNYSLRYVLEAARAREARAARER